MSKDLQTASDHVLTMILLVVAAVCIATAFFGSTATKGIVAVWTVAP